MSEIKKEEEKKTAEQKQDTTSRTEEKTEKTAAEGQKQNSDEEALKKAAEKIEELEKENADLKDQLLRRAADFDNYRKRMLKEKQDAYDFANTNLLQDLLESLDNFDRTVEAADKATDPKTIAEGVRLISKNLISLLENKYSLTSYGEKGDPFNPEEHQAIGSVQGPVASPELKDVYLKGYKLKDRVIRHAKVMVTMPDGTVKEGEATKASSSADTENDSAEDKTAAEKSK